MKVGFNGGNTWIDKAIQCASGSEYCNVTHAFIYALDSVLEARGVKESADKYPGVWLHNPSKFSDDDTVKIIDVDVPDEEAAVQKARELMSTFSDMEELIRLGAYRKGSDPGVDRAIAINPALEAFMSQQREERTSIADGYVMLEAILDKVGEHSAPVK